MSVCVLVCVYLVFTSSQKSNALYQGLARTVCTRDCIFGDFHAKNTVYTP